jgi:hypothetical protein
MSFPALLRARRERPRDRCAEQRNKFAPFHSIPFHPSPGSFKRSQMADYLSAWLLFQQMHYHGSESRIMPLRGIELF